MCAGGRDQLRLPHQGITCAGDHHAATLEIEEHRQHGQGTHSSSARLNWWNLAHHVYSAAAGSVRRVAPRSVLISGRQEPQLVPARVASPTSAAEQAPPAIAASTRLRPTWKQAHTTGPSSAPPTGRPASSERRRPTLDERQVKARLQPFDRRQHRNGRHVEHRLQPSIAQHGRAKLLRACILIREGLARRQQPLAPCAPALGNGVEREERCIAGRHACPRPIGKPDWCR